MAENIQVPRATLQDIQDHLEVVGVTITALKKLEPSLVFFHDNLEFFKMLVPTLNGRLSMLENAVTVGLPAQISQQVFPEKKELAQQISSTTLTIVRDELNSLRQTIDEFRRDATANWVTKSDLEIVKLGSTNSTSTTVSSKTKVPAPTAFTGKREDWKTFSSHLSLYFTGNINQYPSDTDKILFAISRLGSGSAFKYMEQLEAGGRAKRYEGQRPELHAPACPKWSATTRHKAPGEAQASSRELRVIKAIKALREAPLICEGGARACPLGLWRRVRQQIGSAKRELERYARPQPGNLGQSCAKRHCTIL
ncbi:MAG: hypothetical protein J3R72DRAFT_505459 [Linnemannia gamsii]|nr:MAG: hypothetical protein J3R72DRAFT_505459 [Linnemannia gamsii]